MQCYTELAPPSGVTASLSISFLSAQSQNLVVAKGNLLQIFETKIVAAEADRPLVTAAAGSQPGKSSSAAPQFDLRRANDDGDGLESDFLGGDAVLQRAERTNNTKLVLVAEYPLAGTVLGLAAVRLAHTRSGGDALLIHLRDAKMTITQWDPETHELENLSIHFYEQEDRQAPPWEGPLANYRNFLASDPGSRCAMLKFGDRNLAILPFRRSDDDDVEMDDWDEDLDGPRPAKQSTSTAHTNGTNGQAEKPYLPSFVLRFPQLDPSLLQVQHFAFLYEYKEPTFGILSSEKHPSRNLGRKDHLTYSVFTLDLQQKASTQILSVTGLPQELDRVIPLQPPVGGALLVGQDCLVHIDQSGKTHGVGVNPFAKETTSFGLADQSSLGLRLEGCVIEPLSIETGELLLATHDGNLGVISLLLDGRTVSGMTIKMLSEEVRASLLPSGPSCMTLMSKNTMFIGQKGGDSCVIGWTRKQQQLSKRKSRLLDPSLDIDVDDLESDSDEDDDLYGEGPAGQAGANGNSKSGELIFRVHDSLFSLAMMRDFTPGKVPFFPGSEEAKNSVGVTSDMSLVAVVGKGKTGSGLAIINQNIQPKVIGRFEFPEARGFWTMCVQKPIPKSLQGDKGAAAASLAAGGMSADYDGADRHDRYMIVSKVDLDGYETSDVYALTAAGFEALTGTEFDPAAGFTVEAGVMGRNMRAVQVLKSEVRCYDGDLNLSQILPMLDEETGAEPRIVSASVADPFLLLVRDDSSVFVAQMDDNYELEELERENDGLLANKWLTGCLYADSRGVFAPVRNDKGTKRQDSIYMFLVNAAGALHIYALPDLTKPIYVAERLSYLPPLLKVEEAVKKGAHKEVITEILVADLGDTTAQFPYLILRHANDDLTIYEPIRYEVGGEPAKLSESLRFRKVSNPALARSPEVAVQDDAAQESRFVPLRPCRNVGGFATVFLPGSSPSFVVRSAKSKPRVVGLQGKGVRGLSAFHTEGCERGFIYADSAGVARVTQLPVDANFGDLGVSVKKVAVADEDVRGVAYHPTTETYVVTCAVVEPFELPRDDENHRDWARESSAAAAAMRPLVERSRVKLLNPLGGGSGDWAAIDSIELEECEVVVCMETLTLEVSEETKERRPLVVLGTGIAKGEDLPTKGRIYVYDVVSVIPQPGRPETDKKLKLIAREELPRGAVTAVCGVGHGLMMAAQGQKCMVRGLKEDGKLLPMAFMDMANYVTSVRELPGTGLILMADAFHGVCFTGYQEEPFRLILFGKSATTLQAAVADFLPDGKDLYCIVASLDGDLHVMQYEPDHPRSLMGYRLLHRTTFACAPNGPAHMRLLPRTTSHTSLSPAAANGSSSSTSPSTPAAAYASATNPPQILLMSSPSGQLASLVPLPETSYRRLVGLTGQLVSLLPHAAACNPRAFRNPAPGGRPPGVDASVGGRGVVDGALLARWNELSARQRAEVASKCGFDGAAEVRSELTALLGWTGLAYF